MLPDIAATRLLYLASIILPLASARPPIPDPMFPDSTKWQRKFQPVLDFDTDSCYNSPAIDSEGNINPGLCHYCINTTLTNGCREPEQLLDSPVYARTRCNFGWCAHFYAYYFLKDVRIEHIGGPATSGHRHDWAHVVVFAYLGQPGIVSVSTNGAYHARRADDPSVRYVPRTTNVKVVYHKEGIGEHALRFAVAADDAVENHSGDWVSGPLLGYENWEYRGLRDMLMAADFGQPTLGIADQHFEQNLARSLDRFTIYFDCGFDGSDWDKGWD